MGEKLTPEQHLLSDILKDIQLRSALDECIEYAKKMLLEEKFYPLLKEVVEYGLFGGLTREQIVEAVRAVTFH